MNSDDQKLRGYLRTATQCLFALGLIAAAFTAFSFGQDSSCPHVEFFGNEGIWMTNGGPREITLKRSDAVTTIGSSEWNLSRGKVIRGQGSRRVLVAVEPSEDDSPILVSVKISNLPERCDSIYKTEIVVSTIRCGLPIDQYGAISKNEEKARLDNLFIQLNFDNSAEGFFVIGLKKGTSNKQKVDRLQRVLDIIRFRKYDLTKLTFAIYFRPVDEEERTTFQISSNEQAVPYVETKEYTLVKGENLRNELSRLFKKHP